jgi:hypothetical protein
MTLIKDVVTLKKVIGGVQKTISWQTFEAFINQAELEHIVPAIGERFYIELDKYTGDEQPLKLLIERLQIASGYYALALATPQLILSVGDAGANVNVPGNTQAMAKWMYVELRDSAISKADRAMEDALQYLEKNEYSRGEEFSDEFSNEFTSEVGPNEVPVYDLFKTWRESPEFTISRKLFISSATALTFFFPAVKNSRRTYLEMREYLIKNENYFIKPLIGEEFFNYLKSILVDVNHVRTPEEKQVLELLRFALANKAFSDSLPYMNMNKEFRLVTETDGVRNEDPASQGRRDGIKAKCDDDAKQFANKLKAYMDRVASATVLTAYYTSPTYANSIANKSYIRKPIDPNKPFVSI